jgi:retinol-binding protein 3
MGLNFLTYVKFFFRKIIIVAIYIGSHSVINAQSSAPQFPLNQKDTKKLVDSLSSQINKYYITKDVAVKMSSHLKKRFKDGKYNNIKDPHTLAGLLTSDLLSIYRDEHIHIEYNPVLANEVSGNIEDVPRMVAEKLKQDRSRNFGFKKTEILNGNIGYLELSSFSRLNAYSKETANAALKLLSNSNALIIDLRYGVGGSPEMVNHIISHFFYQKTHFTDIYIRSENATLPYWTTPDTIKTPLHTMPIFVLTSYKTFSAAEGLAYALQTLKRATIVGEVTRGGAHTVSYRPISSGFVADIPFGKAISPVTKKNWEKTGVIPDIKVNAENALETAEIKIFENAFANAKDSSEIRNLKWHFDLLNSINHPITLDTTVLSKFAGVFGPYVVSFSNGQLYYQKTGKAKFPLIPMTPTSMRPKGNDTFIVEFYKNLVGKVTRIATLYEDGKIEYGEREE